MNYRIFCPRGHWDDIEANDPEHARICARLMNWHRPTITPVPPQDGRGLLKGQCNDCYELESED